MPRYHQSTNGAIERQHRTIKESLKASLVEMGDTHQENWMMQLPFTLLGRRVAVSPDFQASPADMAFGAAPVLPGIIVQNEEDSDPHVLLKSLQMKANRPPIPMS